MACSIQLVRLDDFAADIDSIDLSANGYSLAVDGYFPVVAPIGAKSVHEVITLKLQGTSKDDLADMTQEINDKIRQAQWWMDDAGVERYQVWLRVQQENETYPRQAQLLNIIPPDKVRLFTPEEIIDNYIGSYSLGIERTPYWEDPYPYPTTTSKTDIDVIGGMVQLSETINGDVPARMARLSVITSLTASSSRVSDFWCGWKTSRFGNPANFIPVWELHYGGVAYADTSAVADATAYDGTKVTTSFATVATLTLRDQISVSQIMTAHSGTLADQRGSYLVLLRAKMSDTSVARVQMIAGQFSGGVFNAPVYRSRVVVSGTAWNLYELGAFKMPPSRLAPGYTFPNDSIGLLAERISGSGSLDMDCVILIPFDDGAIKLNCTGSLNGGMVMDGFQAADDSLYALATVASGDNRAIFSVIPKPQGQWSIPANNEAPYLVIAANDLVGTTGNVKGKTLDLSYAYIPRFRTFRGNIT